MQRLVHDLLLRHAAAGGQIPTNGRFVFYELEQQGFVSKSKPEDRNRRGGAENPREQDVTDALTYLREQLIVPWEWVEDETRTPHEWEYAATVAD